MKRKLFKYFLAIVILIIIPFWLMNEYFRIIDINTQKHDYPYNNIYTIANEGIPMLVLLLMLVCAYFSIKLINVEAKIEEALKAINNAKQKE